MNTQEFVLLIILYSSCAKSELEVVVLLLQQLAYE